MAARIGVAHGVAVAHEAVPVGRGFSVAGFVQSEEVVRFVEIAVVADDFVEVEGIHHFGSQAVVLFYGGTGTLERFALEIEVFGVVQGLVGLDRIGDADCVAEFNRGLVAAIASLGIDDDDAVCSARPVDGRSRGILQYVDRFDFVGRKGLQGIDALGVVDELRNAVDDVERGIVRDSARGVGVG